jgi:predicted glycosyltransferase
LRAWIDIDNPPQARYLLPIARHLERSGHEVLVTARAHGDTFAILREERAPFEAVGASFGRGLPRKLNGLVRRTEMLCDFLDRRDLRPQFTLSGSRAAALAARKLRIPSFVIIDYEYVDLVVYGIAGSHILYPDVIDAATLKRRGLHRVRLIPFDGLKEDISFAEVDLAAVPQHDFANEDGASARILFRPPEEESHYFRQASRKLALELLIHLAAQPATVVLSPRNSQQISYVDDIREWRRTPIVLREPLPFVSLLKGVDAVVSAGGTMLREAAYLGVPAYSIFRGTIGAVDRHLARLGRLAIIRSPSDFGQLDVAGGTRREPLRKGSHTIEHVTNLILDRVEGRR